MLATGNDAAVFKGQTVRVNIANASWLKDHQDVVNRYMKAYRETVDFMYHDPKAIEVFPSHSGSITALTEARSASASTRSWRTRSI